MSLQQMASLARKQQYKITKSYGISPVVVKLIEANLPSRKSIKQHLKEIRICSLDTSFRFLLVSDKEVPAPYTITLSSAVGPIYIKDYTANYFDQEPKLNLNERFQSIVLETESGVVDRNVEIIDLRKQSFLGIDIKKKNDPHVTFSFN